MATKITEVIHVNHELDLLEAHLVEASEYADRIVVKEGECNWNGVKKPLHVTNNLKRFKKYDFEIMVIPEGHFFKQPKTIQEMRINENGTRQYGWKRVSKNADYVIECDVDEIINAKRISELTKLFSYNYEHISLKYHNYLWYMNNHLKWHTPYRVFKTGPEEIQLNPKGRSRGATSDIGWHFSGCIKDARWEKKYLDMNLIYGFKPEELATIDWARMRKEKLYLDKDRSLRPLGGVHNLDVDLKTYPKFVRENPELFPWFGNVKF